MNTQENSNPVLVEVPLPNTEFLLVVAEENFFRGYEQALMDLQEAQDSEQTS